MSRCHLLLKNRWFSPCHVSFREGVERLKKGVIPKRNHMDATWYDISKPSTSRMFFFGGGSIGIGMFGTKHIFHACKWLSFQKVWTGNTGDGSCVRGYHFRTTKKWLVDLKSFITWMCREEWEFFLQKLSESKNCVTLLFQRCHVLLSPRFVATDTGEM